MTLKNLIRIHEGLIGLAVGIFWINYPNDFSEPTLVIFASIIILLEAFISVRKVVAESTTVKSLAAGISVIVVLSLLGAAGYYLTSKYDFSQVSEPETVTATHLIQDTVVLNDEIDTLQALLNDIKRQQTGVQPNHNNTETQLPAPEEVSDLLDVVGAKIWQGIKMIAFWILVILIGTAILGGIAMTIMGL